MTRIAEYKSSRELVSNLTLRELRGRYKRSMLGWGWSLLNPLASVIIYTIVFSVFLKIKPPVGDPSGLDVFALFLLCGLIPWNLFATGVMGGLSSLVVNGNLIKKVYFPRELLVASTIFALVVTALIEFGVLLVMLLIWGNMVIPWIPMLLVLIVIETTFVLGIALAMSVWNVYFRDLEHLTTILIQVIFYMTPIVYPIRFVPDTAEILGMTIPVGAIYRLNPMVEFVGAFRNVLYDLTFPPLASMAYMVGWAIVALVFGLYMFNKLEGRIAEEV